MHSNKKCTCIQSHLEPELGLELDLCLAHDVGVNLILVDAGEVQLLVLVLPILAKTW